MSDDLDLKQLIESFEKTAKKHLAQEINGHVDLELSNQLYEITENLVVASEEMLEDDLEKELKELKRVLIPSESAIESAQVLSEALVVAASVSVVEFLKGFFGQLGRHAADRAFNVLEILMDPQGEYMINLSNFLRCRTKQREEPADMELVELRVQS